MLLIKNWTTQVQNGQCSLTYCHLYQLDSGGPMKEKLVKVDWTVAKSKIVTLRQQAITKVATQAQSTRSFLSNKFSDSGGNAAVSRIADRGIDLTRKQLDALERFKHRVNR